MDKTTENSDVAKDTTIQTPRPSSPRKFFARIYGHLEENSTDNDRDRPQRTESESSSDLEIGEVDTQRPYQWPPAPLPLCPRPLLMPHHQLAFGAGLAAFCKYLLTFKIKNKVLSFGRIIFLKHYDNY